MTDNNRLYPDMSREEREKLMAKQCLRTEQAEFARTLTYDDLMKEQSAYAKFGMNLAKIEAELKSLKEDYAGRIKSVKLLQAEALKTISTGKREVTGKLYLFPDLLNGKMRFFDVYGEEIGMLSRALSQDEKQTRMFIGDDKPAASDQATASANEADTQDVHFEEVKEDKEEPIPTDAKEKKKAAAKAAKAAKIKAAEKTEAEVTDLNAKVQGMAESHRKRKEAITNQANNPEPVAPGSEEPAPAATVDNEAQAESEAPADSEQPPVDQIPRNETFIDPKDVGDGLPE